MTRLSRFHFAVIIFFVLFSLFLFFTGYFNIGLISDDYLNFYDATHSGFYEKVTGKLPFTNVQHVRPVYYFSIEKSYLLSRWLGFGYDNFVLFRIQNLGLLLLISFIAGRIILYFTGRWTIAFVAVVTVVLYPNNLNNICWTAARVDLLCGLFYITILYYIIRYIVFGDLYSTIMMFGAYVLALFTKETSMTIPLVVTLFIYFIYGKEAITRNKYHFIAFFAVLLVYLSYRFIFVGNDLGSVATLYQFNPFSNAPGVIARAFIGLTIPLDFLTLNRMLKQDNKIVILYLAALYGAGIYLIWVMFKVDVYKHTVQLLALAFILISPYIYVGYIRPQMVLIPFIILMIYTLWMYNHHRRFNAAINKKVLKAFYAVAIVFWIIWSWNVVLDWGTSYSKARENVNNLIGTGLEQAKNNVIIGSPGRYKQTFLFDKLTGAYNFWKEKSFAINDTINDVVQTGALDESSIGAALDIKSINKNEFEIKATGKTQFFYIEGYDLERIKTGFINKDVSVEFTEFNYLDKPIKLKLNILNDGVNCYLATGFKFIRIY